MSKAWSQGDRKGWRAIRQRILIRDRFTCQLCGETEGQMHVDHIIPKRLMGKEGDYDENLRVLCKRCNLAKGGSFFDSVSKPPTLHERDLPKNTSISHE